MLNEAAEQTDTGKQSSFAKAPSCKVQLRPFQADVRRSAYTSVDAFFPKTSLREESITITFSALL
jgi:hypothetical protein